MKHITTSISSLLELENTTIWLENLKEKNPIYTYQETTILETFNEYKRLKSIILTSISSNLFDTISYQKRKAIFEYIQKVIDIITRINSLNYNYENPNIVTQINQLIINVFALSDLLESTNIELKILGIDDFKKETKKFSIIRKEYEELVNAIKNARIDSEEIKELKESIDLKNNEAISIINSLTASDINSKSLLVNMNELDVKAEKALGEVETKKLSISTFSTNIDEYKQSIEELKTDATNIINRKDEIEGLVNQAKEALKLNSAIGISSAFSNQYESADKSGLFIWGKKGKEKSINLWLIGSIIFIAFAVGVAILFSFENVKDNNQLVKLLVSRVGIIAMLVTGATFCANQYIKLRNIAEDYAYKLVLSKSINAFTDEIKNSSSEKVGDYLIKVLDEIHKDPLRSRDIKQEKSESSINPNDLLKILLEKVSFSKGD